MDKEEGGSEREKRTNLIILTKSCIISIVICVIESTREESGKRAAKSANVFIVNGKNH